MQQGRTQRERAPQRLTALVRRVTPVTVSGRNRRAVARLEAAASEIVERMPYLPLLRIWVGLPAYLTWADAYAEAAIGVPVIRVSSDILAPGWTIADHFMPVAYTMDPLAYLLAHEWGHVHDDPKRQPQGRRIRKAMSRYGDQWDETEAYAEAFAEWHLTRGDTDNHAAQAYARRYQW